MRALTFDLTRPTSKCAPFVCNRGHHRRLSTALQPSCGRRRVCRRGRWRGIAFADV